MSKHELKIEFEKLLAFLKLSKNVSDDMVFFDGHSPDIEKLGYFFYEGVLPGKFPKCLDACRYILGNVLEIEFEFDWKDKQLYQPKFDILVNLEELKVDQNKFDHDEFDVIEECFESVKDRIQKIKISGS